MIFALKPSVPKNEERRRTLGSALWWTHWGWCRLDFSDQELKCSGMKEFSWALTIFIWCFSFLEQSIWIKLLGLTHIKTGGNCPSDTKGHVSKTDMLSPVTLKTYLCNKFQRPGDNFQNLCQTSLQWIGKLNTGVPHLVNRWVSLENPTAEKAGSFHAHGGLGGKCQATQNHP